MYKKLIEDNFGNKSVVIVLHPDFILLPSEKSLALVWTTLVASDNIVVIFRRHKSITCNANNLLEVFGCDKRILFITWKNALQL